MKNLVSVIMSPLHEASPVVFGMMGATHLDTYLQLISDGHRRRIIHQLRDETTGKATVEDLVDQLHGGKSALLTAERTDRDQLSIQLIHNHLPKLDEHGIIQYDQENKVVRYQPNKQIETVLDALPTEVVQTSPIRDSPASLSVGR